MDTSKLLSVWLEQKASESDALQKKPAGSPNRLSNGQKRLFFLQQLNPSSPFYNFSELYTLRGNWDIEKFKNCIYEVCQNHEIFSYNFKLNNDHEPEVVINKDRKLTQIEHIDLSEVSNQKSLKEYFISKGRYSFDLSQDCLFRVTIVSKSKTEHKILLTLHHIITDEWSMRIFRKQLLEKYKNQNGSEGGSDNPGDDYNYLDYSYHQGKIDIPEKELNYWKEKLSNASDETVLPVDKKPAEITHSGQINTLVLPLELTKKIKESSREQETTLFTFFLAVYNTLLHRYSGADRINIGTPISNRNRKEWESLFGFFIETVLLQTRIPSGVSFKEYLKEVKNDVLEAFDYKKVPYETIVSQLSTQREVHKNPLFRTMFLFHHKEEEKQPLPGLEFEYETFDIGVAKFDLSMFVEDDNKNLSITFEYATDYFEEETIERMQGHFQTLLEDVVSDLDQEIDELDILTEEEQSQFENWNETDVEFDPIPIDRVFENIAIEHSNAVAVTDSNGRMSYQELNDRSTALANKINKYSQNRGRVGLFLGRNADMIIAMLGSMKSGSSYVPLDPSYPDERIQYIIKDANIDLVVTSSNLIEDLDSDIDIEKIEIDKIGSVPTSESDFIKSHTIDDEAYVIYTSGSTGKPKGVSISHKNLFYSTFSRPIFYDDVNPSCFLLFSSFSFDSSVAGIYWTLLTGGHLLISRERAEQDIKQVANVIHNENVSHMLLLPSLYEVLLLETDENLLKSLEVVMVAGEACSTRTVEQHFSSLPTTNLYNEYGPTEATVWCIAHKVSLDDLVTRVPIGRPIPGSTAYILGKNKHRVPVGVTGDLYIGGEGVSGGYIGNAAEDNDQWVNNPYGNGKLYKTGDQASFRKDGNIDFWGRADNQVKIRGHRVELKEIEEALSSFDEITRATVIFDDNRQKLVAFVIQHQTPGASEKELKQRLKQLLPVYMIPSAIRLIEEFPRLPNGKIDQKKLLETASQRDPEEDELQNEELSAIEKDLIEIWEEVLGQSNIGVNDNYFALGGDSISSIRVVSKAKAKGIDLSPTQIFETQTIKEISAYLKNKGNTKHLPEATSTSSKSPIQHWYFDFMTDHPNHWHQIMEFETQINKTEEEWKQLFHSIIQRHQALRSYFNEDEQIFTEKRSVNRSYPFMHFFRQGDKHELTQNLIRQTDITADHLFHVIVLSGKQTTTVRLIAHHLVIDLFSFNQILQEISAELSNNAVLQPTYQYSQFANYLEQLNEDGFFDDELSFWEDQFCRPEFWEPFYESDIREHELVQEIIELTEENTNELVRFSQDSSYKMEEIVLASLLLAINKRLEISEIMMGLEHNGRELPNQISLSDSVGWFTSSYPRKFTIQKGDKNPSQLIETLRETPNYGIGFGVLKYLEKVDSLEKFSQFPISYNYIGKLVTQDFNHIDSHRYIAEGARNAKCKVFSPFDFSAGIADGKLYIKFLHPQELFSSNNAKDLLNHVKNQLLTVTEQLTERKNESDDNVEDLSDTDLNELSKLFDL
ncbi:non-ribosomal peptide synthetase [Rhodohalobacter sulfatireducens]|uniref:Amino acid adenylation domain-containing protein n=1 Tax=Rhodohalobacter sulfatireducens TaxID=2911366 RepID=A0ABS9KJ00_9BACT|nr:non-ribosomal peptide synthetase [Rhodohalobacter sulfatireducens]MCG2590813.1 amino acid adenylation domain-containing protein [Rhodohalobacter sulfatireducens]